MKKILLYVSTLVVSILPINTIANNIQIYFIGEIVEATCKISHKNSSNKEVLLGKYPTTIFPTVGSVSKYQSIELNLEACKSDNYTLRIIGNTVRNHSNLLEVTGGAIGIGVEILNNKNEPIPIFMKELDLTQMVDSIDNKSRNVTFNLRARYKSYQKDITPGKANSNAIFTISYK